MTDSENKICYKETPSTSVETVLRDWKFIFNNKVVFLLKLLVTVLIMLLLVKKVQLRNIVAALREANFSLVFLALGLLILNVYVQYGKWQYLLKLVKPELRRYEILSSLLAGFTLGFITPGRVGELGRALFIKNCSRMKVLGLVMLDKMFSMSVVFLMGTLGLVFLIGRQVSGSLFLGLLFLIAVALALILNLVFNPGSIAGFLRYLNHRLPFKEKIELLISSLDNFHRREALPLLGMTLLFYAVFSSQFYLLVKAFQPVNPMDAFLAISSTLLVKSLLPISLGDLGVRESAAVFFLAKIGIMKSSAFNASLFMFLINLLIPSLVGFVLILKTKLISLKAELQTNRRET